MTARSVVVCSGLYAGYWIFACWSLESAQQAAGQVTLQLRLTDTAWVDLKGGVGCMEAASLAVPHCQIPMHAGTLLIQVLQIPWRRMTWRL